MSKPGSEQRQVFIGNLSYDATETELAAGLEAASIHVFRARIATDQDSGRSRGFAFVDIDRDDLKSVEEIISIINRGEIEFHGRAIRADYAHSKPRNGSGGGGGERSPQQRRDKPRGGRGHGRSEFQRGRNEFEDG